MSDDGPTSSMSPDADPPGPSPTHHIPRVVPGDRLGAFVLTRLLGVGGMGAVFEAVQDAPRRTVAVKVLAGIADASASAARRLRHEAELQGRLAHPGIAQVFDAGVADTPRGPVAYYAMEYIPGARSLTRYAHEKKLSLRDRAALLARVCDAAEHGHRAGVVHRDLTPANILVDADARPRIIDFGIARHAAEHAGTLATRVGTLVGTLRYMSPEQCEADPRAIDPRSDIYSLGVVLYELACDGAPYELDNLTLPQAVDVIRRTPPRDPGAANPECRGDLAAVIRKALAKDKHARYQSAAELGAELDRFASGQPVHAGRDSPLATLDIAATSFVRRRTAIAAGLVALLAFLFTATVGVRILYRWTGAASGVESWLSAAATSPAPLDRVAIIRFDSRAGGTDFEALARSFALDTVKNDDLRSLRLLHAHLMDRLASASPSALGWLPTFRGEEHAQPFARAAQRLRDAGCSVWVGVDSFRPRDSGPGALSPTIAAATRVGFVGYFVTHDDAALIVPIAADVGAREPLPSLALGLAASARHAGQDISLALVPDENAVHIRAARAASGGFQASWLTRQDRVRVFAVAPVGTDLPAQGLEARDQAAMLRVDVAAARQAGESATLEYQRVLTATDAQLRQWLSARVVLIADAGADKAMISAGDTAPIWAAHLYAAAIDMLLSGARPIVRSPGALETDAITLGAAILGVLVTSRGRVRVGLLLLAALTLALALGSVALLRAGDYLCNPVIPVAAACLAGGPWLTLRHRAGLALITRSPA
ncbi:MAG: serine/threonine protein kinase [Phycisphaerae bacterium]|nr:serine/threonine protein kinase [Phycisphaerae bacterium]